MESILNMIATDHLFQMTSPIEESVPFTPNKCPQIRLICRVPSDQKFHPNDLGSMEPVARAHLDPHFIQRAGLTAREVQEVEEAITKSEHYANANIGSFLPLTCNYC